MKKHIQQEHEAFQLKMLEECLGTLFHTSNKELLAILNETVEWLEIEGGSLLFEQDDEADGMYVVISGRLAAYRIQQDGTRLKLGEIGRGETAGELALFTGGKRSAEVRAIRSSVLVKITRIQFKKLLEEHSELSMNLTKLIIERHSNAGQRNKRAKPAVIFLQNIHAHKSFHDLCALIPELLQNSVNAMLIDRELALKAIGQNSMPKNGMELRKLIYWLNENETQNDIILLAGDEHHNDWDPFCQHQADRIVRVADASCSAEPAASEVNTEYTGIAEQFLLLVHPEHTRLPENTAIWLQQRPELKGHYHVRAGNHADYRRFARLISGYGIGLVLAGGGAKGFAHLGVYKALQEHGIDIDAVGGTSIGALVGAAMAFNVSYAEKLRVLREAAMYHPTKDFNYFLMMSLIRGIRIKHVISSSIRKFSHLAKPNIEDTWLPMFAVSSNYTMAREEIHTYGPLARILRASCAIPGVFPPVILNGELHIDGGTFNNFPANAMRNMGIDFVIGTDFVMDKTYKLNIEEIPTPFALFLDKFRKRSKRKFRLPSLTSILLNSALLCSYARRQDTIEEVDLHFNPSVSKLGFTNWKAFDRFVEEGYKHAQDVLKNTPEEILNRLR